jgi:hypothetical protein
MQLYPGLAGRYETSLALALRATIGDTPARDDWPAVAGRADWFGASPSWREVGGYTDSPAEGSGAEGAALLEVIVDAVAAAIVEFDRATR